MQRVRDEKKRYSTITYDSYHEFLEVVDKMPSTKLGKLESRKCGGVSFFGTEDFPSAMKLAREGWPEGLAQIERLTAQLEAVSSHLAMKPEIVWDVAGDFADAGLYACGIPECMGSFVESDLPQEGSGKCVRILMNLAVSCGVDQASMIRRGAAAVALIDALENAGRSCEVVIASGTSRSWTNMHVTTVKQAGEPLELDRMAFALAHPAGFRRLFFSALEHADEDVRQGSAITGGGDYGCPTDWDEGIKTADISLPSMSLYDFPNDAAILAWITEQLKAQGCTIEGEISAKV